MRQSRYLNTILTVNAALLAVVAWSILAGNPLLIDSADAQVTSSPRRSGVVTPPAPTIPNASAQRYQQLNELREIRALLKGIRQDLQTGGIEVTVNNVDQLNRKNR